MAITYNWTIANLEHNVADGGVTGGANFAVGMTLKDKIFQDEVSQSPSLAVTGLTPGGNYTVILEVAKSNFQACTAEGLVNYVHG